MLGAAAAAAAILASLPEGDPLRKVISTILGVLAFTLIIQNLVERWPPGGRISYGVPYAICAAASVFMVVGQSMRSGPVMTSTLAIAPSLAPVLTSPTRPRYARRPSPDGYDGAAAARNGVPIPPPEYPRAPLLPLRR